MDALSDSAAEALCGLAQKALEEKGVDPILAAAFAERACRPLVGRATSKAVRGAGKRAKKAGGKVKRKASAYNKKYSAAYKRLKKKHPRMKFASLAKKAHKEARRK